MINEGSRPDNDVHFHFIKFHQIQHSQTAPKQLFVKLVNFLNNKQIILIPNTKQNIRVSVNFYPLSKSLQYLFTKQKYR
jgi:hypothetical protein